MSVAREPSANPASPGSRTAGSHGWVRWLSYTLAALSLGAAYCHPAFSAGAWLAVAALSWGVSSGAGRIEASLACVTVLIGMHFVGFHWTPAMSEVLFGGDGVSEYQWSAALLILSGLPVGLCLVFGAAVLSRFVSARWWMPMCWAVGERLRIEITQISISDWLATQWQVEPVLRALGHLGWWCTLGLCLFAAVSLGQGLAKKSWAVASGGLFVGLVFALLPPLDPGDPRTLEGVAVVHAQSAVDLPHRGPRDTPLELVVWPEAALDILPRLVEGRNPGARLSPMLPGSSAQHLLGLITRVPMVGEHNQVVHLDAAGAVQATHAKRILFPVTEAAFLGMGRTRFRRGQTPPLLEVAGRQVIPAICGEYLNRSLVAEGHALGGELLTISARDGMMPNDIPMRQLLAVQVLRSVEFHIPSVRSSFQGWSSIVRADGHVVATARASANRIITWSRERGAVVADYQGGDVLDGPGTVPAARPSPEVAVLYSRSAPHLRTRCPEGTCRYYVIEDFDCSAVRGEHTVILAGHAQPPMYLSHPASTVAAAVRCFSPTLVVADACFGSSSPLVESLSGIDAVFVGATTVVPEGGLTFGRDFFEAGDARTRAEHVSFPGSDALARIPLGGDLVEAALSRVEAMGPSALREHLVRRIPTQVWIEVYPGGHMLVPVDWARLSELSPTAARAPSRVSDPSSMGHARDNPGRTHENH